MFLEMPATRESSESEDRKRGDEVLRRMLKTPPQPRKKPEAVVRAVRVKRQSPRKSS
jgi:hypothetical protein